MNFSETKRQMKIVLINSLISKAKEQYKNIEPCINRRTKKPKSINKCYQYYQGVAMLYFNTPDHFTHTVTIGQYNRQGG